MATKIYGASDDLIEVDGDEFYDEFNTYDGGTILCSNGLQLCVWHNDDGFWRISNLTPAIPVEITVGLDVDTDYSDVAVIADKLESVHFFSGRMRAAQRRK